MPAIADFLRRNESRTLEFKQDLSSPDRVLRAIVAFANTTGGTLVVGITDDKRAIGLANAATEEEWLANLIAGGIAPAFSPDFQVVTEGWLNYLVVRVPRFPSVFYVRQEGPEEGVYIRHGSTNRRATPSRGLTCYVRLRPAPSIVKYVCRLRWPTSTSAQPGSYSNRLGTN